MEGKRRSRRRGGFRSVRNPKISYLAVDTPGAHVVVIEDSFFLWRVVQRIVLSRKEKERTTMFKLRSMVAPYSVAWHSVEEKSTEETV